MKDFRKLNQQVNKVKRILNSFIQKLTAQVEKLGQYLESRPGIEQPHSVEDCGLQVILPLLQA
jgi:hypothetical protein